MEQLEVRQLMTATPIAVGIADVSVLEFSNGTIVDLSHGFTDADGGPRRLAYELTDDTNPSLFSGTTMLDGGMALDLKFNFGVVGSSVLTVRATDSAGHYAETSFSVTVTPVTLDGGDQSSDSGHQLSSGNRRNGMDMDSHTTPEVLQFDPYQEGEDWTWATTGHENWQEVTDSGLGGFQSWVDGSIAVFPASMSPTTITVSGTVSPAGIEFDATGIELTGGIISLPEGGTVIDQFDGQQNTIASKITGGGTLSAEGYGGLTLSGTNDYSGGTYVSNEGYGGTEQLSVGSADNLGDGGATVDSGGILAVSSDAPWDDSDNTLTLENGGMLQIESYGYDSDQPIYLSDGGVIDTNGHDATLTGTISGDQLTKIGAGTLALSNLSNPINECYDTEVDGGTLTAAGFGSLGYGGVTVDGAVVAVNGDAGWGTDVNDELILEDGGTLRIDSDGYTSDQPIGLGYGGGIVDTNGHDVTLNGWIVGDNLTKAGAGALTLTGGNQYYGGTEIAGGTLKAGTTFENLGYGGLTIDDGGTFDLNGTDFWLDGTLNGSSGSITNSGSGTATFGVNRYSGDSGTYLGDLDGAVALELDGGTLTLGGSNNYSGGTNIDGGTLVAGSDNAFGSGALTVGGTLDLSGQDATVDGLGGGGTIINSDSAAALLTVADGGDFTGQITDDTGTIALKVSSGDLTLSGDNTYSGGTEIDGGTLQIGDPSALGLGSLKMSGGTLDLDGSGLVLESSLDGSSDAAITNSVAGAPVTLVIGRDSNATGTFRGVISGNVALELDGGSLDLTGDDTYDGDTTIDGGVLVVTGSIASSAVEVDGGVLAGGGATGLVTVADVVADVADTTVEGASTVLSVLGGDENRNSRLTYTWTFTKSTGADDPVFFVNDSNSAKTTEVFFTSPGTYDFTVTIANTLGETATGSVSVAVTRSLSTITVAGPAIIQPDAAEQYSATAYDQFGTALATQPGFTWNLAEADGTLSTGGIYTAPATATTATLVATSGTVSGIKRVNVGSATLTIATPAAAVPPTVDGATTDLSVLGTDTNGEADLTYTWQATVMPTGATAPVYSVNGTNAAKDTTATFSKAGDYTFQVTVTDSSGDTTTSDVSVIVDQTLDGIQITPPSPTVAVDGQIQLAAAAVDQFGNAISGATIDWQASGGTITSGGLLSAPDSPTTVTVVASSGALSQSTAVVVSDSPTAMFALENGGATQPDDTATVSFDVASGLNLPDSAGPFTYSFDFGNTGTFEIVGSSSTATVPAAYLARAEGSLTVRGRVQVQGSLGWTDYTTSIPVIGVAPVFDSIGSQTVTAGATLTVSPTFSAVATSSSTYSYAIDWGDGSTATTGTTTIDASTALGTIGAGSFGGSHVYDQVGQFTVHALVTDSQGDRDIETFTVQVTQPQATYNASGTASATAGTPYNLNLVAAGSGSDWLQSWTIDWGDGTPPQQVPGGIENVEHLYTDPGAAIIWATATDGRSTFDAGSVQVQVAQADDAISGSAAAAVGVPYTLNLTVASGQSTPDHWTIDWGDGSAEQEMSGGSQQVQHTFASAGSVSILTTVTDSVSTRDAGIIGVIVNGTTPTAPSPAPTSPMTYALTGLGVSAVSEPTAVPNEYEITGSVVNAAGVPVSDALVQLDLDGAGTPERTTRTDDSGNFSYIYTPASFSQQTVKAQVVEWNAGAAAWHAGPWLSTTYTPALSATVSDIELTTSAETSGANEVTADPTLWGLIDATGIDYTSCLVSVVVGGDPNTLQSVPVNSGGQFYYTLQGLSSSPTPITISASVSWTDPATGLQIQGTATNYTFIYYVPPHAPSLAGLGLAASTDPSGVIAGTNPTIHGTLDPNAPALSGISVQVSPSSDFSGADTVTTDTNGNFSDTLSSLTSSSVPVTVYARSAVVNAVDSTTIYGPVRIFTFTCYTPHAAPAVTSLSVLNGTTTGGVTTASDPTLSGQIDTSGANFTSATVQFALSENGDDVIGSTSVNYLGQFTFTPTTLSPSATPITIYAQSCLYDATTNSYRYSAWQSKTFTYTRADYAIPTVTLLEVSHPTGNTNGSGAPIVTDPTIDGQVKDSQGSPVPYVTVDIDTTGGSQADAQVTTDASGNFSYTPDSLPTGNNTISAWVDSYDYTQNAFVDGTPTTLALDYQPVAPQAPTVENVHLLCPTSNSPLTAANLTIAGNIDSQTAGVAIQYRVQGASSNLGTVLTDANGNFYFVPSGLSSGSVTIEVRALEWNESLGEYLISQDTTSDHWTQLSFDYTPAATSTAALVDLEVANPVATVSGVTFATDPTVTGHVEVLDSGSLSGVTVQISTSDTGSPEQSTTTDAQGAFSFSMAGLDYGSRTLYVRTIRRDANSGQAFTSNWTTTGISPLTFDYVAMPGFASVSEVYATGTNAVNVVGQVSANSAMSQISVQFDTDGDGVSDGSESVNSDGTFTYAPSNFDPSQQLQVRLQQNLGSGNYLHSAWRTVAPPSQSPTFAVNISQLVLTNTANNGATDNSSISGQITGSGDLSGYTIAFDTNGDGSPDHYATTAGDGSFVLSNPGVSQGLVTIAARVSQSTSYGSGYGGWSYLRFYYTVDPSTSESQTVVAALSQQDPTWQSDATGIRNAGLSSSDIQNSAQAANDAAAAALEALESSMVGQAADAQQSAMQSSDSQYSTDMANAASQYASEMSAYTGDPTTESLPSFAWPDAPDDNAAVVGGGDAPPAPSYDGPAFNANPSSGPLHDALAAAQSAYDSAVGAATSAYTHAETVAGAALSNAELKASNDLQTTLTADATTYNNTIHSETDDSAIKPSSADIADTLQSETEAAYDTYNAAAGYHGSNWSKYEDTSNSESATSKAMAALDSATATANAKWQSDPHPTYAQQRSYADDVAAATEIEQRAQAKIDHDYAYAQAEATANYQTALAAAQQKAAQATAVYNCQLADFTAQAAKKKVTDDAKAQQTYTKAIDADEDSYSTALAQAAYDQSVTIGTAQATLLQAQSAAERKAIDAWSTASGRTPWTEYQAALAADASAYYAAARPLIIAHATSLAGDAKTEAEALATHAQTQADAAADATYTQATQTADALEDYALDADGALQTRDAALATSALTLQNSWNAQQKVVNEAIADSANVYDLSVAAGLYTETVANDLTLFQAQEGINSDYVTDLDINSYTFREVILGAANIQGLAQNSAESASSKPNNAAIATNLTESATAQDAYGKAIAGFGKTRDLALASAAKNYADTFATATAAQTKADVTSISGMNSATAQHDATYIIGVAGAAETWTVADANAQASFQTAVATDYANLVTQWNLAVGTPWSAYQKALAVAQKSYVARMSAAVTAEVTTIAEHQLTETQQTTNAENTYAGQFASEQSTLGNAVAQAVQSQASDVAQAAYTEAESVASAAAAQGTTKAQALGAYQKAVAAARKSEADTMDGAEYAHDRTYIAKETATGLDFDEEKLGIDEGSIDPDMQTSDDLESENTANSAMHDAGVTADGTDSTAFQTAAASIASAHEAWIDAESGADASLTHGIVTATQTFVTAIDSATSRAADNKRLAETNYGANTAADVETLSKSMASTQRNYTEAVASAETAYNSTSDSAASAMRETAAGAADSYALAIYANHADAMVRAADALDDPLISYQAAAAAADLTYMSYAGTADTAYQASITAADALQTEQLDTAETQYAQAEADAAYNEAVQTAAAIRAQTTAVSAANARLTYLDTLADAQQAAANVSAQAGYQDSRVKAESAYLKASASAATSWMEGWVQADVQYVSDVDALPVVDGDRDTTSASNTRADSETSVDETLEDTLDSLSATRRESIGDAQIDLATTEGAAAVARARTYGEADVSWAAAVGSADTALSNAAASAQAGAVAASSSATTQYEEEFSSAMTMSDKLTGAAAVDYQALLGAAFVVRANSRAIADAAYQSAVAGARAFSSTALADPYLPFEDRAATAYAAWIDAMGGPYIAYATEVAQAEADYENAATVAATRTVSTSATTPDDSAALAQAMADYVKQDAALQAAQLQALAKAEAAHTLAQAQASSALALAQAQDQKNYETGLSAADAATDGPTSTVADSDSDEKTYTDSLAGADETWSVAVLAAQHDLAVGEAAAQATLVTKSASIDKENARAVADQYAGDEETMARAQIASWDAATTSGNAWNTATTMAETAFVGAGYSAQAAATAGLVEAMPSGAAGRDWAQFRADLASAQAAWWGDFASTIVTNTYVANLSASAYQAQVDASYLSASTAAAQADSAYIVAQATAQDNQIASDARANRAQAIALDDAAYQAGLATAEDLNQYEQSPGQEDEPYTSSDRAADDAAAGAAYTLAVASANAADAIALAQDQADVTIAEAQSTAAWTQAQDGATLAVTVTESQAYATEQMNLASLAVSTYTQMGDSYATAMAAFAADKPTPWAKQEAASAASAAAYNDQALLAWLANQRSTLAANSQAEISEARAEAALADQTAASAQAAAVHGAAQQLAAVRALQLAALAQVQANPTGGAPSAPGAPNLDLSDAASPKPGIDPAYVISRAAASDYNLNPAAADAQAELIGAVYADPWSGWWSANSGSKVDFSASEGEPVYDGLSAVRAYDFGFDGINSDRGRADYRGWANFTVDGSWHGGWSDGEVSGIFIQITSTVASASAQFTTYINAHTQHAQGNFAVQAVSTIVGLGVGLLTSEFGPIVAGAAGMAAMNATSAFLYGELAGHSAEQIISDTLKAGVIGAAAGAAGGAASMLIAPMAAGLAGTLGLTCENGLGAVGAFVMGGADGAAFGAASGFTQTFITTGDLTRSLDAAGEGAFWGGLIGGVVSVGINAIDPFVCFTAGTQVVVAVEDAGGVHALEMSEDHLLYAVGKGWTPISEVMAGDELLGCDDFAATAVVSPPSRPLRLVTKNVEDIVQDDFVVSRNENDPLAPLVLCRVDKTYRRRTDHLRIFVLVDERGNEQTIETTDDHPVYVVGIGRMIACQARVGNVLDTLLGEALTVVATRREEYPEGIDVYNFRVPGTHTYFVRAKGAAGDAIWVHNANYPTSTVTDEGFSVIPKPETAYEVGVQLGNQELLAVGYGETGWVNPFEDWGAHGQGFDDVMSHPSLPDNYVIVEHKGGSSQLADGQMGRDWVRANIDRLVQKAGWNPWGAKLDAALEGGRLHGVVVSTPVVDGITGPTTVNYLGVY